MSHTFGELRSRCAFSRLGLYVMQVAVPYPRSSESLFHISPV